MRAASKSPLLLAAAVALVSGPRTASARTPPDGETGVLAGRVLSPSGAPLSDASVPDEIVRRGGSLPQVAGVEVYDSPASTVGRNQGSDSRCGVIAICTRAG